MTISEVQQQGTPVLLSRCPPDFQVDVGVNSPVMRATVAVDELGTRGVMLGNGRFIVGYELLAEMVVKPEFADTWLRTAEPVD